MHWSQSNDSLWSSEIVRLGLYVVMMRIFRLSSIHIRTSRLSVLKNISWIYNHIWSVHFQSLWILDVLRTIIFCTSCFRTLDSVSEIWSILIALDSIFSSISVRISITLCPIRILEVEESNHREEWIRYKMYYDRSLKYVLDNQVVTIFKKHVISDVSLSKIYFLECYRVTVITDIHMDLVWEFLWHRDHLKNHDERLREVCLVDYKKFIIPSLLKSKLLWRFQLRM